MFYSIGPFTSTYDASYGTVNPPTPGNSYINCSCTTNNPLIKKTFITYPQESVGIGIATPTEKLEVAGKIVTTNLQLTGGTPGVGKILSSDAIGNASWLIYSSSNQFMAKRCCQCAVLRYQSVCRTKTPHIRNTCQLQICCRWQVGSQKHICSTDQRPRLGPMMCLNLLTSSPLWQILKPMYKNMGICLAFLQRLK